MSLLDKICPVVKAGDPIPWGISRGFADSKGPQTDAFRLMLPLFYWKGERYDISWDRMRRGWWLFTFLFLVVRMPWRGGLDLRFRWGSKKVGVGMVPDPYEKDKWRREDDPRYAY